MADYELVDLPLRKKPPVTPVDFELVELPAEAAPTLRPQFPNAPNPTNATVDTEAPSKYGFNPRGGHGYQVRADDVNKGAFAVAAGQGVTLGYSDEAIAWVKHQLGDDWEKALKEERDRIKDAKKEIGTGAFATTEIVGGMAATGGPILKAVQKLAGKGAGVFKQIGANAVVAAPVGTAAAYGAQDEKDLEKAIIMGGGPSAAMGAAAPLLVGAAQGGKKVLSQGWDRVKEFGKLARAERTGGTYVPSEMRQDAATRHLVDELEKSGTTTPQQLDDAIWDNRLPDTPVSIANARNDRVTSLTLETASKVKNPTQNGQNIVQHFGNTQRRTETPLGYGTGQTQAQALNSRIFDEAGVGGALRTPRTIEQRLATEREGLGNVLESLRGQGGAVQVPGSAQLINENPMARRAYMESINMHTSPGRAGYIPPGRAPLPQPEYERAVAQWQRRADQAARQGVTLNEPPPVLLTDNNMPIQLWEELRLTAGHLSRDQNNPVAAAAGGKLIERLEHLGGQRPVGDRARHVNDTVSAIGDRHRRLEDLQTGRKLVGQEATAQTTVLADATRRPPGDRRLADQRLGVLHGVQDKIGAADGDMNKVQRVLSDPRDAAAYEHMVTRNGQPGYSAAEITDQANRGARVQTLVDEIEHASATRKINEKTVTETLAQAGIRAQFTPSAFGLTIIKDLASGRGDQTTRKALLSQLLDLDVTSRDRVVQEMARRAAANERDVPAAKTLLIQLLSKETGVAMGGE